MKKVFALLLTLAMVLSLAACGGNDTETSDTTEDTATEESTESTGTDTGLTEAVNLTLLSQGAGTDDYITTASEGKVFSPFDGVATTVFPTGHAVGLTSDDGIELLIHIGLDTVKMRGDGFTGHVKSGDHVKKGDLLLEVDLEKVKAAGYDIITPVIVCNTPDYASVKGIESAHVNAGDDLIIIS